MATQNENLKIKYEKMAGLKYWLGVFTILVIVGCGTFMTNRTVLVPHGDAVRLRETVKNVKVWIKSADGEIVAGTMDLPEGWYCLPLEDE
jgi:hypothetical protein